MKFELYNGGKKFDVEVNPSGEALDVAFDGKRFSVKLAWPASGESFLASVDGRDLTVILDEETESKLRFTVEGRPISLGRAQVALKAEEAGPGTAIPPVAEANALISPLFGKVISVDVKTGDSVDPGQSLIVLEAMKMESVLRADGKHVVKEVLVKEGDGVQKGQPMIRFG